MSKKRITNGFWSDYRCIDCGRNTCPGNPPQKRAEIILNRDGRILVTHTKQSEVYFVRKPVWKKAGMQPWGGCLCIGCLEKRLGRRLNPKDFAAHDFNLLPGTRRLINRRGNAPTTAIVRTWINLDDLRNAAKKPEQQKAKGRSTADPARGHKRSKGCWGGARNNTLSADKNDRG